MQVVKYDNNDLLDSACADFMIAHLQRYLQGVFCPASGNSPTGAYGQLAARADELDTRTLKVLKLDEWAHLPIQHSGSCESYLQQHILQPLSISDDNYTGFNSDAADADAECSRIHHYLAGTGPINLCVLGLGLNGHIAFDDPAEALKPHAHLAQLSEASLAHGMVKGISGLSHGYTLGMADILQARTILLIVNGRHKAAILQQLLTQRITTQLPASLLWLHADAHCYYCED
jgi:galactosamine-6-phosphate isomerase